MLNVFSFRNNIIVKFKIGMSVRPSSQESEINQIQKIAENTTSKDYFLSQQQQLLDEWANRANALFIKTGQVMKSEYQIKSSDVIDKYSHEYEELYNQSRKQFEAYCILNRKVQKKGDEIQNFAAFFNSKNHKKTFFNAWKDHTEKNKYLRKMDQRAQKYKQTRTLKTIMKEWLGQTMKSTRNKIKNEVLQKTEIEISKIQGDYEKLIKSLQEVLQKKLIQLKKEEQEHKQLHDKYEAMYTRTKVQQG